MKQLQVYAPVKGPTGYEILARDLIEELDKQDVHVCLEEFRHWGPFEVALRQEQHAVLSRALKNKLYTQPEPITNLSICLPEQVKGYDHTRNVNLTMFEADNIPTNWVECLENVDEVIVPTDFNRWSFTHTNDTPLGKISVLPIGYSPERYNEGVEPLPLTCGGKNVSDFPIRFLVICEVTERKNFFGTLHCFYQIAARYGVDQCCLIMRVGNYSKSLDLAGDIKVFRQSLINDGSIEDLPYNVFNYSPILPEAVHPNFIAMGTHYLSTSFGEGWDLTAMQAAACGLHLFVPMHSAYQCWLDSDSVSFLPIAKKMQASQAPPTGRLYENSNWYAYHMPSSVDLIVSNIQNPSTIRLKKDRMRERIQQFHWSNLIDQYMEALHL